MRIRIQFFVNEPSREGEKRDDDRVANGAGRRSRPAAPHPKRAIGTKGSPDRKREQTE
jgi:hypothetical protein